jgi:hypothetical protein
MVRAIALLLFLAFPTLSASAQSPFQVAGFRYELDSSGMHFYSCEAPSCGIKTTSFQYQDGPQEVGLAQFEDTMRAAFNAMAPAGSQVEIVGRAKVISSGKLRVWTMATRISHQSRQPNYVVGGFITGGVRRLSLISGGSSLGGAQQNFDAFARKLKPIILKGSPL